METDWGCGGCVCPVLVSFSARMTTAPSSASTSPVACTRSPGRKVSGV